MMDTNIYLDPQHWLYRYSKEIDKLCEPIKRFGINLFNYIRIYENGYRIVLSNQTDWNKYFFANQLYKIPILGHYDSYDAIHKENLVLLLSCINLSNTIKKIFSEHQIHNGLIFINKYNHYVEYIKFFTNIFDTDVNNFYVNNIDLFRSFCHYFKKAAKTYIDVAYDEPLLIVNCQAFKENCHNCFYSLESVKRSFRDIVLSHELYIKKNNFLINLSKRELQCINHLVRGCSAREVALKLNLSPRTVEFYIANIKRKVNCRKKSELIKKLYESGLCLRAIEKYDTDDNQ